MLAIKNPIADNGFIAVGGSPICRNKIISNCHPVNTNKAITPTAMTKYFDQRLSFCCKTVSLGNFIPILTSSYGIGFLKRQIAGHIITLNALRMPGQPVESYHPDILNLVTQ